jgi:hypothetical protein
MPVFITGILIQISVMPVDYDGTKLKALWRKTIQISVISILRISVSMVWNARHLLILRHLALAA